MNKFHVWAFENFPFMEETYKEIDNYHLMMDILHYLKEQTKDFKYMTEEFEKMQKWFDDLNIQDEVNNKLDEMAESGELQEIISEYLNSKAIFGFDTVSDMKSATNLINGSYAKTLGYYESNDGGAGIYKIRTIINEDVVDGGSIIEMNDETLIAELICDDSINVKQFGAYGDGSHNDTTSIQNAINYAESKKIKLLFSDDTYLVTSVTVDNFIIIDGLNATIKSINNNDSEFIFKLYYHGCIDSIVENLNIDGNRENNLSYINGLVIQMYNYADTRLLIKNVKVNYCSNYGVYITGNWSNTSVREMRIQGLVCYKNKIGLYANSLSDSYIEQATFDHNDYYGAYLDNTATVKISSTKAYWNGGKLEESIDVNRLPNTVLISTSDVTPVAGKKYYTRTGRGDWQIPYVYTEFTGSTFDSETTYYEVDGEYKNHGNGFYLKQCTGTYFTNCEIQDNAGDGIYSTGGNLLIITNVGLDNNGLIFDDENAVYSYSSQGLNPYFYGLFVDGTIYTMFDGYANNYRYNQINYVQKSGIYCNNVTNFEFNILNRLQQTSIDYKLIDIRNFGGKINGIEIKIPVDLSNFVLNTNYSFNNNNWNGSYIYIQNKILYFKLLIDNNTDKIPTSANTEIGTVNYIFRPILIFMGNGVVGTFADEQAGTGYMSIDPNGRIRVKSDIASCRFLSISNSYIIKD